MDGSPPTLTAELFEPLRFFALLLLLPLLAACDEPAPPLSPAEVADRDSVLTVLLAADTDALAAAFDRLDAFRYRVETRTVQFGPSGDPIAYRTVEAVVAAEARALDVVAIDSAGAFEYGGFAALASDGSEVPLPTENLAPLILPEDLPFLDSRGREAFSFHFEPDTLLGDQRVRVVRVDARPGEGDDQPLRHARLYLDAEGALVGVRLRRRTESVLFSEASDAALLLHPGPAGGWLPHRVRFDTAVGALFTDRRRFRLQRFYSDFAPAFSAEVLSDGI